MNMMLQVIAYTIAVAAVLSGIGACMERFARLHRWPGRTAWAAAMLLSVLLPAAMIFLARPAEGIDVPRSQPEPAGVAEAPAAQVRAQAPSSGESTRSGQPVRSVPAVPSTRVAPRSTVRLPRPSDRLIITMWIATSSALSVCLLGANVLLRRRMKGWHNATVQDHPVLVSEVTGPALLGVVSPRIVVPRWLLSQPRGTQALILQHERQHVLARDALLIMTGLVAIVAVPWNLPLWWQWRRMRQAIEMDCDARVLGTGAEAGVYAQVLLAVTQRAGRTPAGALAMSEPAHVLERRIANLLPDAIRYARLQAIALLLLAGTGAGVALALEAPAPATRAVQPAPSAQIHALARLAKEAASFTVWMPPPVAEPSPHAFSVAGSMGGQPPRDSAETTAGKARLENYYAALMEKLAAVPGLRLITEATPAGSGAAYEISMRPGADWKGVVIEATSARNPSGRKVLKTTRDASLLGNLSSAGLAAIPADDPDRDMDLFVQRLRLELFPPDRALLDQLMSELRDPRLEPGRRAQALGELMTVDSLYDSSGTRLDSFPGRVLGYPPDPALLGAAIEVAMTDRNPQMRLAIWNSLVADPLVPVDAAVLVAPAARALASETDLRVQLTLVNILNLSAGNPEARAALESTASDSADSARPELVRMAAQRVLNGGAGWNDYFVARLKDPRVPDAERVELIQYAHSISGSGRFVRSAGRMKLDEAAEHSLGSLLKSSASTEIVAAAASLLGSRALPLSPDNRGSSVAYGELLEFLQAGTGKPEADPKLRDSVLRQLLLDLRSHPEARPVLAEIAARDRDPVLREAARRGLEQASQQ